MNLLKVFRTVMHKILPISVCGVTYSKSIFYAEYLLSFKSILKLNRWG